MKHNHDGMHESWWGHMAGTCESRSASGGDATSGGVCLGAEARSAMREQATWVGVVRAWRKTSGQLIIRGPSRQPIISITIGL
jgi:hypothetical protein